MTESVPRQSPRTPVVGLLGAVASGKSTVARMLGAQGAHIVDADRIGHEVLRDEKVRARLCQEFGDEVLGEDGQIDRSALGRIVFEDAAKLARLNSVVHPRIVESATQEVRQACLRGDVAMVVLDAALLLEKHMEGLCDVLVFVEVGDDQRRNRAQERRGWPAAHLAQRDAAQAPIRRKRDVAQYVLYNDGTVQELQAQVAELAKTVIQQFRSGNAFKRGPAGPPAQ